LTSLTQCSIVNKIDKPDEFNWPSPDAGQLPGFSHLFDSGLRELHLEGLTVQLEPSGGCPGVLQACSGLTALQLKHCVMPDTAAAAAAIAALPQLESLGITSTGFSSELDENCSDEPPDWVFEGPIASQPRGFTTAQLQHFTQLKHLRRLSLVIEEQRDMDDPVTVQLAPLCQLSELEDLNR
jgi:hypothetical protein